MAPLWEGTAWQAATLEAQARVLRAEGDATEADRCLARAADLFELSTQPLDATRVRLQLSESRQ